MKTLIKNAITKSPIYPYVFEWQSQRAYKRWLQNGQSTNPPHKVKQQAIKEIAQKFNLQILVETGTYLGDMVNAMKDEFSEIYSIEVSEDLFHRAQRRFKQQRHIHIIQGDSSEVIEKVVANLNKQALFWLDGHYSAGITKKGNKECPVYEELTHIRRAQCDNNIILIDDARCFNGTNDYPSISDLNSFMFSNFPKHEMTIRNDIIHLLPKEIC